MSISRGGRASADGQRIARPDGGDDLEQCITGDGDAAFSRRERWRCAMEKNRAAEGRERRIVIIAEDDGQVVQAVGAPQTFVVCGEREAHLAVVEWQAGSSHQPIVEVIAVTGTPDCGGGTRSGR
jgi:hypothetical protein